MAAIRHVFTSPQADVADPTIVRPSNWNDTHAFTLLEVVSLGGNTAGVLANISSGTLLLAGGNNVTLSQNANSVTISGASQSIQTQNRFNLTLTGNTSGVMAQVSSGTLTLAGGNNITLSQAGNAITISAFTQTVQTQNRFNLTLSGNTSGALADVSSGTLTLAGGNNITLSQAGNAVTISAASQTVQTQNLHNVTLSGNTAGVMAQISSGTLTLAGGNNITLSQNGNAVTISGAAQTDAYNIISAGTQIAGTQATVVFSNSNGLAFGMTNNSIITGSYSQSTHGHTDQFNIISAGTQIAGTAATIVFSNSNGVAFGMTNNSIVTASYSQSTHAHSDLSAGMSTQGNTSGTTGLVAAQLVLVGGDNVTLSQSVNGQSATLTISAGAGGAAPTLSHWANFGGPTAALAANSGAFSIDTQNGTLWVFPLDQGLFPGNMSALTVQMMFTGGSSSNWTNDQTIRYSLGIYTRVNASSLSLLYSASSSYTDGATSQSSLFQGHRWVTFGSADFNAAPNFSMTEYYGALWLRSSGQSRGLQVLGGRIGGGSQVISGTFGAASASANSVGVQPWHGYYSVSFTTGMPTALHRSDMIVNATAQNLALFTPFIVFNNYAGLYG